MNARTRWTLRLALCFLLSAGLLALAGCGVGDSALYMLGAGVNNTQLAEVNTGPAGTVVNGIFTSVTLCQPGTSNCQTIPNVLVDSGTEGLRLLSSATTLTLPPVTVNGNPLQECVSYADGSYLWGAVLSADVQLAEEKARSVPVQLIDSSSPTLFPAPSPCTSGGGPGLNTVASLGANGILGIGVFRQDCGLRCTLSTGPNMYYLCSGSDCRSTTAPLRSQLQNPVWMFPVDNNGVLISLPSIPSFGARTVPGLLIFGVGTQPNNQLGNARIYTADENGNITTTFNGVAYSRSYIDSGSDAYYFLNSAKAGILPCTDHPGYYCPKVLPLLGPPNFTVTITGQNGTVGQVTFSIQNADGLLSASGGVNAAFNNLGGPSRALVSPLDYFDFGVPFFYGRNVFVGIENQVGPNGVVGPYWAY